LDVFLAVFADGFALRRSCRMARWAASHAATQAVMRADAISA